MIGDRKKKYKKKYAPYAHEDFGLRAELDNNNTNNKICALPIAWFQLVKPTIGI